MTPLSSVPPRKSALASAIDAGGGRAAESGMQPTFAFKTMNNNQADVQKLERDQRRAEVQEVLRQAVGQFARQLMIAVPPGKRSAADSQLLSDCLRKDEDRKGVSSHTLSRLFCIAAQTDEPIHALSESIRAIEIRMAAALPLCAFDESLRETEANGPLNAAQQIAAHEDTPVRWWQVAEIGRQQLAATRRMIDAAVRRATMLSARNA